MCSTVSGWVTERAGIYPGFTFPLLSVAVAVCFAMSPVLLEESAAVFTQSAEGFNTAEILCLVRT